jgi:hypothetical protein
MRRQDQPDIRRDKVLERLIDIGIYDRGEHLDLNNNSSEERSFRYTAALMNMLWDWVHDMESKIAFALVLCCHITEQLPRTFVACGTDAETLITPSNMSVSLNGRERT